MHESYIAGFSLENAAGYLTFYWGGAMVGRFIGSAVLQKVNPGNYLGANALIASLLVCHVDADLRAVAMWAILAVGLFNSIMFPSIFTLAIEGLGPLTGEGFRIAGHGHRRGRDHS